MWELKENGILLSSQPIEGGRGQFSTEGKPKAGDKDKVSHEHWGGPISRTGRQGVRKTRRRRSRLGFSSFFSFSFSMMMMIQYFFCVSEENGGGLLEDRRLSV
mmetsp:Transcript_40223/g.104180  ORF Transcript_40223/g.104180 Transcript_40223/m.104180 type:complete len:103 (+) Transcript_40223:1981-2289(+)